MPVSESKRRNNDAYNAKCDRIEIKPIKPVGTAIRSAAAEAGPRVQASFLQAVRERMARDGFTPTSDLWPNYERSDSQ